MVEGAGAVEGVVGGAGVVEALVGGAGPGVGGVFSTIFALERVIFPLFAIVIVKVKTISAPLIV